MAHSLAAFLTAFILGVVLSRIFRRTLAWLYSREQKPGKEKIHRLFPKPRRPLGGGVAIMLAATISVTATLIALRTRSLSPMLWVFSIAWAYALIGIVDDLRKTAGRGLGERSKLIVQVVVALLWCALLWFASDHHELHVPFIEELKDLGIFFVFFGALVIIATANAVNLSDGIDGLAGGLSAISFAGVGAIVLVARDSSLGPIPWSFCGAVLGFLVFNFPPARILMGDTGALGLGAALGSMAILSHAEFWLFLLAAPFVINAGSVVLQMGAVRCLWRIIKPLRFRRTEATRPFLCAPLHHHFQWLAWDDRRILALYWTTGAVLATWALLSWNSGPLWLVGVLIIPLFLLAAAIQKVMSGRYYIGLAEQQDQPAKVALYRGIPVDVLCWRLYRKIVDTSITEGMLAGATAESVLWRPLSEIEAHVMLGKIYADHRLLDQALEEWEQVPTRSLVLRPAVMLQLAKIYYGRDRLLEAIKLWEQMPVAQLAEMPNLREVVRSAKLRLADLAGKSYRQAMRLCEATSPPRDAQSRAKAQLEISRRYNQELLSLLLHETNKLRGRPVNAQAARSRRELLRRTREVVLGRVQTLDSALSSVSRSSHAPAQEANAEAEEPADRIATELGLTKEGLLVLIGQAGEGIPEITGAAVHPKASRNTVFRIFLKWPNDGPNSIIAKLYAADRIDFFSACYRRDSGVLRLLREYGASVPIVYASELHDDRALLLIEDLGDETLAERLEGSDDAAKHQWLRSGVSALVALHSAAYGHQREIAAEISKVDKDILGQEYYSNALRIAIERIAQVVDAPFSRVEWQQINDQSHPLVDFLAERRKGFIHFEFTPHHLLITPSGLFSFDFEQATLGPPEFDLAALLAQPESNPEPAVWREMIDRYAVLATESGIPVPRAEHLDRAMAYAALFKCLVYAGAAANFLAKFGGEHHLQRFHYYIRQSQELMRPWRPLRPLAQLLAPRLRASRSVSASGSPDIPSSPGYG